MKTHQYPLSVALPVLIGLACAMIGGVAIVYQYDASYEDFVDDESSVSLILANITASELEYQLRQNDEHEARKTLDRLKIDRNLIMAALLDDEQEILFSTDRQLRGGHDDLGLAVRSVLEEVGQNGLQSVARVLPSPLSSLVATPIYLPPENDELSSARLGVLLVQRDLLQPLQQQKTSFRNTAIFVGVAILALSTGLWLVLRKLLFHRMNLILAGLSGEEATFTPPAKLTGSDELSTIADGFHRFTRNLQLNTDRLAASEEQFRTLFEQSAVGMARVAPNGDVLTVNDKACAMLGYAPADALQLGVQDIIHPDDLTDDLRLHQKTDGNEPLEFVGERRCVRSDRKIIWVNLSISAVRSSGGGVDHYVCVIQDISESVVGRHQLLRAQAVGGIGSWAENAADDRLYWSDEALRIIGVQRTQFAGTAEAYLSLVHPDDSRPYRAAREKWLREGGEFNLTYRILRPNGDERWIQERAIFIRDDMGLQASHFGTIQDVTDRVLARQELERRQNFFETVLECSGAGIVVCDHEGAITTFNRVARLWHGQDVKRVDPDLWPTVFDLYRMDGRTRLEPHEVPLWRAFNGEIVSEYEFVIAPKGGPRRIVLATAVPVFDDDGHKLGAIASMLDITDRTNAEQALRDSHEKLEARVRSRTASLQQANVRLQELDRLKSLFIASMSHELRTPLNSVIGFTGLLLQEIPGPVNEKQQDYLQRISRSGQHLLSLITNVIDIAKFEAGKAQVNIGDFDLSALIEEVVDQFRIEARDKGLALHTRVPEGVRIVSDRHKVAQCLMNYVSNALKYTLQGGVTVELNVAPGISGEIEISVIDSGVGIAVKDRARLFKQFSRIDSENTRSTPGTGLGLYLTHKIATELLGGLVSVESSPGEGSVFRLYLPKVVSS